MDEYTLPLADALDRPFWQEQGIRLDLVCLPVRQADGTTLLRWALRDCRSSHDPYECPLASHDDIQALLDALAESYNTITPTYIAAFNQSFIDDIDFAVELRNAERSERAVQYKRIAQAGWVYLIKSPTGHYKIGKTGNVQSRWKQLRNSLPFPIEILHTIESRDMDWAERHLHERFAHCRTHGEWFQLSDTDVAALRALTRLDPTA